MPDTSRQCRWGALYVGDTSRIRAVTFDAGGTLIHWFAHTPDRFGRICRLAGIDLPEDMFSVAARACARYQQQNPPQEDVGGAGPQWWRALNVSGLRAAGVPGDLEALADRVLSTAATLGPGYVLDPDVPEVLHALQDRGIALAVVSNWDGDLVERLGALGIAHHFRFIADSDVIGVRKPDPGIYHTTCAALGIPPESCVHVGDRPDTDGAVARAVGATPVIYDPLDCWNGEGLRVSRLMDVLGLV